MTVSDKPGSLRIRRIILFLFALHLTFCSMAQAGTLKIVTTTSDLASVTKAVAGDKAEVTAICNGKEDPHFLQAKPGYILLARDADLWIRIGMDLEAGWEGPVLEGSRNRAIQVGEAGHLDGSEYIIPLEVPEGRISRGMGDVHPHGNPHYWLDPLNVRILAGAVRDRLVKIDPENSSIYNENLASFIRKLDEHMFGKVLVEKVGGPRLWEMELKGQLFEYLKENGIYDSTGGWIEQMKPLMGEEIVVYHRSWVYFVRRFGLHIGAELEPKPGIPPGPSHLVKVMEKIRAKGIRLILMEPFYHRKAADKVALETGVSVVICPNSVNGDPDAADYFELIDLVINRLNKNL